MGVLLLGVGVRGTFSFINDWQGIASLNWARTGGTVVWAGLEQSHSRGGKAYSFKIKYRYIINNIEYLNNRISFPETRNGGGEDYNRRKLGSKYPVNGPCTVYYDPKNPAASCLEPGPDYFHMFVLGPFALLFLGSGMGCVVLGSRMFGRRTEARPRHGDNELKTVRNRGPQALPGTSFGDPPPPERS